MSEIKNPGTISAVGMCLLFFFMLCSLGLIIMQLKQMEVKDGLVSPLYSLLLEQSEDHDASQKDKRNYEELLEAIHHQSSLESKTFVISETIFPVEEKDKLRSYVKEQLKGATGVLSSEQVSMVTSMVELLPKSSGVLNKGCSGGSLRNWAVLALIRLHEGNIHFTMAAAVIEPHLGMLNWIPRCRRNRWNHALSRVVQSRVREEVAKRVQQQMQLKA